MKVTWLICDFSMNQPETVWAYSSFEVRRRRVVIIRISEFKLLLNIELINFCNRLILLLKKFVKNTQINEHDEGEKLSRQ